MPQKLLLMQISGPLDFFQISKARGPYKYVSLHMAVLKSISTMSVTNWIKSERHKCHHEKVKRGPFFVHFVFYVNSRQAFLLLYYNFDTSLTWNCHQETFQKSKMTALKPCSSTSGQFIDIKKVIGNMRIAALGLDIISLLAWKWF